MRLTLDGIVRWFETLTRESAADVDRYYTSDARFKDLRRRIATP